MSPEKKPAAPGADRRGLPVGELAMAAGVLALGLFYFFGAWAVTVLPSYARIGPRFFPYLVGSGLILTGTLLIGRELRASRRVAARASTGGSAVLWIVAALALNVALMERTGYIVATTLLFALAARGLGSRRYVVCLLAGFGLGLATYLAFTRLLDLHLPPGWLAFVVS